MNPGLERRFPWKFSLDSYSGEELCNIFFKQARNDGWKVEDKAIDHSLFENNKEYFKNNGGDTENLFQKCKIAHSHRIFCTEESYDKRTLNIDDIENGFELHKDTYPKDRIDNFDALGAMYV